MSTPREHGKPGNTNVDSYVVRIYRRTARRADDSETLTGLVEDANNSGHHAFHSMHELWDILRAKSVTARSALRRGRRSASDSR